MSDYLLAICERASSLLGGAARFYLFSSRLYAHARNRARLWLVISGVRMGTTFFFLLWLKRIIVDFPHPPFEYMIPRLHHTPWPCPLSSFVMQSAVFQWFVSVLLKGSFWGAHWYRMRCSLVSNEPPVCTEWEYQSEKPCFCVGQAMIYGRSGVHSP